MYPSLVGEKCKILARGLAPEKGHVDTYRAFQLVRSAILEYGVSFNTSMGPTVFIQADHLKRIFHSRVSPL